jgi:hypothetical protein
MFTQDVEDFADPSQAAETPPPSQEPPPEQPKEAKGRKSAATASAKESRPASADELKVRVRRLWETAQNNGMTTEGFRTWAKELLKADKSSKEWTEAEVAQLEDGMHKLAGAH